ncbi:putative transposase [Mycobacterium kansasii]|uniref:Putative transposase n=1 Tax=Mycobacterium kansasii TaxID=1768 RepID=A0A1V3WD77_MYCKA|nr:putative transposase [Mycobacterium kansasii]
MGDPGRGEDQDHAVHHAVVVLGARGAPGVFDRRQEAFLEGHVYGFERLGGVPVDKVRYDNLNSAVKKVLFGRSRQENERWIAFRSHYGFEAWYCQPGHEGSHEKGGVEGEGGRFRRNHCVPMPVVDSIDELNALLQAADDADDARRVGNRSTSVGQDWAFEKTLLRPLPAESFDTALTLTPRVDRYAQVAVRCNQYSVPARFIGHRLRVKLSASAVVVYHRTTVVAATSAPSARAPKSSIWITIWRSCCASPAPCPAPQHWRRLAQPKCSPPSMRRFGSPPAKPTVMPGAPGCSSKCCCCIAIWIAETCWPASPPRYRSGPPALMWLRWKRARPPSAAARRLTPMMPTPAVVSSCWPSIARRPCRPIPARCPRCSSMTSCWGEKPHDPAARRHRAGSHRGDRARLSYAAPAHDSRPVCRNRRRRRT